MHILALLHLAKVTGYAPIHRQYHYRQHA
ncbi:hypothetical protein YPPY60_3662, partial [Yersinia pestis PY-60]